MKAKHAGCTFQFSEIPCVLRETINKKKLIDALEAVKHSKREVGPYCTISGNEPSSVTLYKTGIERQTFFLQFQEFTSVLSKSKTHITKGAK